MREESAAAGHRAEGFGGTGVGNAALVDAGSSVTVDGPPRPQICTSVGVLGDVQAHWIDEEDPHLDAMGSTGIGEIGIVGTAAAVSNAVCHATGVRVRDLPITLDELLEALP